MGFSRQYLSGFPFPFPVDLPNPGIKPRFPALQANFTSHVFPGGSDNKESACNVGDPGLIPGLGRSPGEGDRNPLQYSCLENSMDRGGWRAEVHGLQRVRHT